MIGCVFTVELSSSAGPCSASFHRSCFSASEASSKTARTSAESAKPCIMPTAWEPCPGNTNASFTFSPSRERGAPRKSASDRLHEHVLTRPYPPVAHGLVERAGDRCRRGIRVPVDGDDHLFHAEPEFLRRRLDDPDIGLV